ncbi:MAG: primosomal protein N', partial [Planctomycetota bacterium]
MRQKDLFDAEPAEWEVDAAQIHRVAAVAVPLGPDGVFDYLAPDEFQDADRPEQLVEPGRRVRVPLGRGNREVVGYCVAVETRRVAERQLKPIREVVDSHSLLSREMLRLTRWMADYYLCPWGQVLEGVVPAGVRGHAGSRVVKLLSVPPDVRERIDQQKLRSPQQRKALRLLAESDHSLTAADLADLVGCTVGPIRQLLKQGLIEAKATRVATGQRQETVTPREPALDLNADQQSALSTITDALEERRPRGIVLHGVTGSGKTEVYLQAIEKVVGFGRQAIVLVPEISLTPQTVRRFRARFDGVAVLHSHLSDVERHRYWQSIAQGEVQVIVGARSAVFAPTKHLGLIVIDEEHEATFKQDSAPRYHARDVAWRRAEAENIPLILGSATPSLESWQLAAAGEFRYVALPKRVLDRPMPDVAIVDP